MLVKIAVGIISVCALMMVVNKAVEMAALSDSFELQEVTYKGY